jgi:hypothetical protein
VKYAKELWETSAKRCRVNQTAGCHGIMARPVHNGFVVPSRICVTLGLSPWPPASGRGARLKVIPKFTLRVTFFVCDWI